MNRELVHETLQNARAILAERGLARRSFEDSEGRVCGWGALNIATHGDSIPAATGPVLNLELECRKALGFTGWGRKGSMSHWFDEECGSLEEALARFDKGIERTAPKQEAAKVDTCSIHLIRA